MNEEISRFVRAVGAGEVWEQTPRGWWRLEAGSGVRALVLPGRTRGGSGYAWAVQEAGKLALRTGHAPTEHEAMRAAERVLEELR